jgi:creatinine amidohydrolase/Fe(II)-dependent formamide hydrolase-like protein
MTLTWQNAASDFKERPPCLALLPLAGQESHSPPLPADTDPIIVSEIARRVAEGLPNTTFLLPTWPLGMAAFHTGQASAVSLSFATLSAVVTDVVASLYAHGIRTVAVINGLGSAAGSTAWPTGNTIVKTAIRQLNYETPGLTAIWVQPFAAARYTLNTLFPSADETGQTEMIAAAIRLYLTPTLAGAFPEVSVEKGKLALEAAVEATGRYIEQTLGQLDQLKR